MNGIQLECTLASNPCIRPIFRGVFSRDTLPSVVTEYPSVYVVNTDLSSGSGEHWIAIVLENEYQGLFFDSFGRTPEECGREFTRFLNLHVKQYDYFKYQIQSNDSVYCGYFVLAFIVSHVCMFVSMITFKNMFDVYLPVNDGIVYAFVERFYDICV